MSHTHHRTAPDANAAKIVAALRAIGCSVEYIASVYSAGVPDLLVGVPRGTTVLGETSMPRTTVLMEVKRPKRGRLRESQSSFIATWRGGPVVVVTDVDSALAALGLRRAA